MNATIDILIKKLESLTNKKVILQDIKPTENIQKLKEEMDKNIKIVGTNLIYTGDVRSFELKTFETYYKNHIISVYGNVFIDECNLKEIPVQFNIVTGAFDCSNNHIISLKNCAKEIGDWFNCSNNCLNSLNNCPIRVDNNFYCGNNFKKFTEDEIRELCKCRGEIYIK